MHSKRFVFFLTTFAAHVSVVCFRWGRAGGMVVAAEAARSKSGRVDWSTVRGLMVDAIYGGRVDNPHDMRVLSTYLRRYLNSDVVRAPSGLTLCLAVDCCCLLTACMACFVC